MKIAIDAMGGDNAPEAIVLGAIRAAKSFSDIHLVLYGDKEEIQNHINTEVDNIEIVHTTEKIASDDDPVRSIRRKKDASMVVAAQSVKNGENDALFSAGNTGALLACGTLIIGRIKGIDRPGLLGSFPSLEGDQNSFSVIDLGANADAKPLNIEQNAVLGSYYAQTVKKIKEPRVALLNNGTEENKGNELSKKAFSLLNENTAINFIGNIEARDLFTGQADIIVTDGFTGNAVLKTVEGTALSIMNLLKTSIKEGKVTSKLGGLMLKSSLKEMKKKLDYSNNGGAVLFGIKAPVVKTHGSTEAKAVYYTILQTREILKEGLISDLTNYFEQVNS